MSEELKKYIKQSSEAGHSQEEIKKSLYNSGWGAQNIENAFGAVSAKINPNGKFKYKKIILSGVLGLVLIVGLAMVAWQVFFRELKPDVPASFF